MVRGEHRKIKSINSTCHVASTSRVKIRLRELVYKSRKNSSRIALVLSTSEIRIQAARTFA